MLLFIVMGDATVNGSVGCELALFLAVNHQWCEISEAAFILLLSPNQHDLLDHDIQWIAPATAPLKTLS
jgi:hypothetical protein